MAALVNRRRCYTGKNSPVSYQIGSYISWRLKTDNIHINTGIKIRESLEASFQMLDLYDGEDFDGGLFCIGGRNTNSDNNTDGIYILGNRYSNNHTMTLHYMNKSIANKGVSSGMGHTYKITLQNAIIDDTVYTYSSIPTVIEPSYTAYIGGYLNQPDKYSGSASTAGCRLFNIIIDGYEFLPAKRLTDNKIGLYCENLNKFLDFSVFDAEITDYGHYYNEYFTIESLEDNNTISIQNVNNNECPTFYYSTDDGDNWTSIVVAKDTIESIAVLNTGEKVIVKNNGNKPGKGYGQYNKFDGSKNFKVYGNIMSLLRGDNFITNPHLQNYGQYIFFDLFYNTITLIDAENLILPSTKIYSHSYRNMFNGCTNLVSAPQLPATTLEESCYNSMFYGCTALTEAPVLPATTLKRDCYNSMFKGCTSLVNAPLLPATTSAESCYNSMFYGCTALTTAPSLPATTLAKGCYTNMFYGCTSLTTAPSLPATTSAESCYNSMFNGCTSLTTAPPNLPAETLVSYCYSSMFEGCVSLTTPPILPATTLATKCYDSMFKGCTSLVEAPELPATTLASYCYQSMFENCVSLEEAPVLPATTLASGCYRYMFCMSRPDKLTTPAMTKAPILPATDIDVLECYQYMFQGNGNLNEVICLAETAFSGRTTNWLKKVSSTGTFIKSPLANWGRNESGIPSGWTVYSDGLLGISISGNDVIDVRDVTYSVAYNPFDTFDKYKGVTWSVVSGSATITQDGVLTPTAIGNVVIQAVSTYDSSIVATKSITVQEELPYPQQYFTIESLENSNTISIQNVNCSVKPTFYYSIDGGNTWNSVTITSNSTKNLPSINTGNQILFKSTNTNLSTDWDKYNRFNGSKNFKVQGNIMSLLYGDDFVNNPEFANGSATNFAGLFKSTTTIVDASNLILPSTKVNSDSYNGTFRDCANLVHAPELPATNLNGKGCYSSMFEGCISLVEAPELPATTLSNECYARMFCMSRTTKLTTPAMTKSPLLPATTVGTNAYKEMFQGNGNLVEITCLATYVGSNTSNWVANVSSTGTFKKNANMSSWAIGTSGIPSGWTVVTADS